MKGRNMDREQQNRILRQHGYVWKKIDQDWLDDNDDFETRPGWHLYAADGREVSVKRAFAEIERGVDVVAEEYRQEAEAAKAAAQKRQDLANFKRHFADKICQAGVRPEGMNSPEGERILDTRTVYGGGDWFVLDQAGDRIWYVRNNGMDGDNWSYNNVRTGGAGAIGWYIPYDEQMAGFLREMENGHLPGGWTWDAYYN